VAGSAADARAPPRRGGRRARSRLAWQRRPDRERLPGRHVGCRPPAARAPLPGGAPRGAALAAQPWATAGR
jgi:hypothetical protein